MSGNKGLPSTESCFADLLESGTLSDVVLTCGDGKELETHRVILHCNSSYFRNVLKHGFKETRAGRFRLTESSTLIKAMLQFMYRKTYTIDSTNKGVERAMPMQFHIEVYVMGDYYGVPTLMEHAADQFYNLAKENWDKTKKCLPIMIETLYHKTLHPVHGIKEKVLGLCMEHLDELEKDADFQKTLDNVGAFTKGLWYHTRGSGKSLGSDVLMTRCYHCKKDITIVVENHREDIYCPKCGKANYRHGLRTRADARRGRPRYHTVPKLRHLALTPEDLEDWW